MASLKELRLVVCFCALLSLPIHANAAEKIVALVGGRVIDGTGAGPRAGQTVLIRGDRITEVGHRVRVPEGAEIIDVNGRSILPGLIDFHGHMYARATPAMRSQFEAYPLLFLAGGVTTVRSPGDFEPEGMIALRDRIRAGRAIGPRIFTAGPYFDHAPSQVSWIQGIRSPEEALQKFDQWKERIDWVKFYTGITEPEMRSVLEAARRAGLPSAGHLGSITATKAVEMGIDCLEHGIFAMPELLPDPSAAENPNCLLADLDLDSAAVEKLVSLIVEKRVVIDPTIVVFQIQQPDFQPVAPDWLNYLNPAGRKHQSGLPAAVKPNAAAAACLAGALQTQLRFVKKVHDRGGIIVAGTDPVSPRLIPGFALHREIENLVKAGL
ncbi:MAG: amidohydrolase family protein, partial [Acidobacteriota bacterium]